MTPQEYQEHQRKLAVMATDIALRAPAKWSRAGYLTTVNRSTVDEIRKVLDAMGIDWRKAQKELRERQKQHFDNMKKTGIY